MTESRNEVVEGRRISSYFVPIAKPKKKGATQLEIYSIGHRIALRKISLSMIFDDGSEFGAAVVMRV
jgi:hypothetical protein